MNVYCIPNLSSTVVDLDLDPSERLNSDKNFASKDLFRRWCKNPSTEHCFYSLSEGVLVKQRVNQNNPIRRIHGLIVDYDAPCDKFDLREQIDKLLPERMRPACWHRTFSGFARVLFEFEEPILCYSPKVMDRLMALFKRHLKLDRLLPGLDERAFRNLYEYYEQGHDWRELTEDTVSTDLLIGWIEQASKSHKWGEEGVTIPVTALREAGEKKFPDAGVDWKTFDIGTRCHRFWDENADAQSVIVRESGCQCFTGEFPFLSWTDIFGADFVNRFRSVRLSQATDGIYFDGKAYWLQQPELGWTEWGSKEIDLYLEGTRGLSKKREGGPSEVEQGKLLILNQKRVKMAFPFLYKKDPIVHVEGLPCLNVAHIRPVPPVDDNTTWGDGFPWIAQYMSTAFEPFNQRNFYLSWLSHFYEGALNHDIQRGLALIIAGDVGAGKNFFTDVVVGQLMGGCKSAAKYLVEDDKYNSKLFQYAVWTVHDAIAPSDYRAHSRFSQLVKKVVANDSLEYRPMYREGDSQEWLGRAIVTLNSDPQSLSMIPQADLNILDKLALLRVQKVNDMRFPSNSEILEELPYFGRYLLQHGIHDDWRGTQRFGVKPYHHRELLESARAESPTATFQEILDMWRENKTEWWHGTAARLMGEMVNDDVYGQLIRRYFNAPSIIGRHLNALHQQGVGYLKRTRTRRGREWSIQPKLIQNADSNYE